MFKNLLRWRSLCLPVVFFVMIMFNFNLEMIIDTYNCGFDPFYAGPCFRDSRKHDFKYLLMEPEICSNHLKEVFLVMAIPSSVVEFKTRMVIRQTWGSFANLNSSVRRFFMLGYSDEINQEDVRKESELYHDIIQEDFQDTYQNLSIKSEAILRFVATFCMQAKYVLKVDVDMYVNIPLLLRHLEIVKETRFIMGSVHHLAYPIYEDKSSKWSTKKGSFPLSVYPDYVSGTAYVMPRDVIRNMFSTCLQTRFYWLEDVFITGIVRKRISIPVINNIAFSLEKLPVNICSFKNIISAHRYSRNEIAKIWSQKNQNKPCPVAQTIVN